VSDLAKQLWGTWAVIRAELGGEPMPPEVAAHVEIEFDAESAYRARFSGEISDAGYFEIFPQTESHPHHRITLHGEVGTNAGRTLPGIFQLRGDRLKLCLALKGNAPPNAFTSSDADCANALATANSAPCYLVTYRRKTHRPLDK